MRRIASILVVLPILLGDAAAAAQDTRPRLERLAVVDAGAGAEVVTPVGREGRKFLVLSSVERALRLFDADDVRAPRLLWTVPVVGGEPTSVAARADLAEIYVAVKSDAKLADHGFLQVFRGAERGSPVHDRTYVVGPGPDCVALAPDELTLAAAIEDEDTPWRPGRIELVDVRDGAVAPFVRQVPLGVADAEPEYVVFDAAGRLLYATLQEQSMVVAVDVAEGRVVARTELAAGAEPDALALSPDGRLLVTANEAGQTLDVLAIPPKDGRFLRLATTLLPPLAPPSNTEIEAPTAPASVASSPSPASSPASFPASSPSSSLSSSPVPSQSRSPSLAAASRPAGAAEAAASRPKGETEAAASRRHGLDPEGVACVSHQGRTFAVVGLERFGELWAFDLTEPTAPRFLGGVPAGRTPLARPEVVVRLRDGRTIAAANEGEGTVALFQLVDGPPPRSADGPPFRSADDRR